jgi:hypothetical protein
MNILFVLTRESKQDSYEYTFALNLFEHLMLKNKTGILTGSTIVTDIRSKFNIPDLTDATAIITRMDFKEWDVIVVYDPNVLQVLDDNPHLNHEYPKIAYLCHAKDYHGLSCATKNILLAFNIMAAAIGDWLPKEKVCNLLKPLFYHHSPDNTRSGVSNATKINAIHFVLGSDDKLSTVKSIIVAFNCLLHAELTIVAPIKVIAILKTIANHNVHFVDAATWDDKLMTNYTVAIVSEYQAVKALYFGLPTLVAGIRGLGGPVFPDNIYEHIKNQFEGRIGGEPGEFIPTMGIIELMMRFHDAPQKISEATMAVTKIISAEFSPRRTFGIIESHINVHLKSNRSISSADNYSLKPFKISGSRVITDQADAPYLVDINNKVIKSVNPKEAFLFAQCNGEKTLKDILQGSPGDPLHARAFILDLWKKNILSFR